MRVQILHHNAVIPTKGSFSAGGYDIYMPESGNVSGNQVKVIGLGFAAEVPSGHVALLLPRSGAGAKYGVELNNSCGVIDSDYRGEWKAAIRTKSGAPFRWEADDRVLQFILVPVLDVRLELVDSLDATERGAGHFGSSGK